MKTNLKPRDHDVFEILEELDKINDRSNKLEWLRTNFNDHKPLEYMIRFNYDRNVVSVLPEGTPPFNTEEQDGPSRSSLWNYLQVFPVFVRSIQSQKMKMLQIEKMFIEMLDSLSNEEAQLVCLAKDRALESKYELDLELFNTALGYNIASAEMPNIEPKQPKSDEEKAEELLDQAKYHKNEAKRFTAEPRKLETQAKKLVAGEE